MKILKRIWLDLKNGENIDLYLTIPFAIGLAVLNLMGIASQSLVTSLTLAVLGVLAIAILVNRRLMERLIENSAQSAKTVFLDSFPSTFTTDLENADELWLVGVTLSAILQTQYYTLEKIVRGGSKLKVLLVHPLGPAIEMAAARAYLNPERTSANVFRSLEDFYELKSIAPENVEIRTINHPLGHYLMALNPNSASGILYIADYPFKIPGGSKPKFVIQSKDGHWYDFYIHEFRNLWDASTEWEYNGKTNSSSQPPV